MQDEKVKSSEQEDPIVMYLIVRENLNMSIGKTAAQVAHASQLLTMEYFENKEKLRKMYKNELSIPSLEEVKSSPLLARKVSVFGQWLAHSGYRKVVLRASDTEWAKIQQEYKDYLIIVRDAGLTELEPGTETVLGLWPMRKSQVSKTIKRLQLLK